VKKTDSEKYFLDKVIESLSSSVEIGHKLRNHLKRKYDKIKEGKNEENK